MFVLITTSGNTRQVSEKLKSIDAVREVCQTVGPYDILAVVVAPPDAMNNIITWKIRRIEEVSSTLTLMKNQ